MEEIFTQIDSALVEIQKLAARKKVDPKTQAEELRMWHKWDKGGRRPKHLEPLLKSLEPFVARRSRVWVGKLRDIPPDIAKAEFQDRVVDAISTFDPKRGVKLTTYLTPQLMRANRFFTSYQNPARIVEPRTYGITAYQSAQERLQTRLGRQPSVKEVAKKMGWKQSQVRMLRSELRKAVPSGQFQASPSGFTMSRTNELMRFLPHELNKEENRVFSRVYGLKGKPPMGTNDIAKDLGISAPKVSRLRRAIAKKIKKLQ